MVIYAAIIMSVLVLMGVGISTVYFMATIRIFDAEGNSFLRHSPLRFATNEEIEEFRFWDEFVGDCEHVLNISIRGNRESIRIELPQRRIYDLNELQKYMYDEIFRLSGYIPYEFEFSHAVIRFFVYDGFNFESGTLLTREEKFDWIYEKWYIPENLDNIYSITIVYTSTSDSLRTVNFTISLAEPQFIDINFAGHPLSIAEILELPKFERNMLLTTEIYVNAEQHFTHRSFTGLKPIPPIWKYNIETRTVMCDNSNQRRKIPTQCDDCLTEIRAEVIEYSIVYYHIWSDYLTHDEIIRIAESIR